MKNSPVNDPDLKGNRLVRARRIVVKIGSALLVDQETGKPKSAWLSSLVADLAELKSTGAELIVVSSGAIALGRHRLGLGKGKLPLEQKQAAASVGQIALAQSWQLALQKKGMVAAQILVTLDDTEDRKRYLNATATLFTLLTRGAVPVINENDTVATSEIRYGDNDRLAARVAAMLSADCLVLLSDIDGLYTGPPNQKGVEFVPVVSVVTREIENMAGKPESLVGSGGMITKIEAAKIAMGSGCSMVIASGHERHPLRRIASGERCTWFLPQVTPTQARKRWIAGSLKPVGKLEVDQGAAAALAKGKSLLPAGITGVSGLFSRGDTVSIVSPNGEEIGRGIVNFDSDNAKKIMGCRSSEIEKRIGVSADVELIHRNNLALHK